MENYNALILSHCNMSVEVNLLIENYPEGSLISQRLVYDHIKCSRGTLQIEIWQAMVETV